MESLRCSHQDDDDEVYFRWRRCWRPVSSPAGGLATAFDLAAFRLSMIAPVKKSVNHSRTVASMRETGWEKQQEAHLRSDSTVWSEFAFIILVLLVIAFFRLCHNQFFSAVMWSLRFPFFWSCVCHYMRFTTLRTKNETIKKKFGGCGRVEELSELFTVLLHL